MIAIGGAIGTGLFLGAGGRLADAGPSLFIAYAVCGVFAFLVVRALDELVLNFAALGILAPRGMIMICHLPFWQKTQNGELTRPSYRLPGSPWTELLTLAFLASVLLLMYADGGAGRTTVLCLPLIAAALVAGWYAMRVRRARTSSKAGA